MARIRDEDGRVFEANDGLVKEVRSFEMISGCAYFYVREDQ